MISISHKPINKSTYNFTDQVTTTFVQDFLRQQGEGFGGPGAYEVFGAPLEASVLEVGQSEGDGQRQSLYHTGLTTVTRLKERSKTYIIKALTC